MTVAVAIVPRRLELDGATLDRLAGSAATALLSSPFSHPARWQLACIVIDGSGTRVTSRADHSSFLRSAGLVAEAHEALARRIPHGRVLVWIDLDEPHPATGFAVFDFAATVRASTRRRHR